MNKLELQYLALARVLQNEGEDWLSFLNACRDGDEEWSGDRYRVIHRDHIDKIQQDELESDPYVLGCFNASFIADHTDLSLDIVEALQSGDKYEALGKHIIENGLIEAIQDGYSSADGYGHHFAHCDGEQQEFGPLYLFRTN